MSLGYKLISVKCPDCGQTLSIEENRTQAFCSYCGAKVLLSNENEYVVRQIDEAGVQKAETERLVRLKELEIQQQRETNGGSLKKILMIVWLIVTIALLTVVIFKLAGSEEDLTSGILMLFCIGTPVVGGGGFLIFKVLPEIENEKILSSRGGIRFPKDLGPFMGKKYTAVSEALRAVGFQNIICVNLHDLNPLTALVNGDKIEKVTVDGKTITSGGKMYMPNVPIVITYHGR